MYEMRSEMKVEHIIEVLKEYKGSNEIAITFFVKDEAELQTDSELTEKEWQKVVQLYETDDHIDQVAVERFAELSWKVINEREKKNVGHGNQSS